MIAQKNDIDLVLKDAVESLNKVEELNEISIDYVEDREYSIIYEISGVKKNKIREKDNLQKYILKINKTSRSCKKEYDTYKYLIEKNINTIIPICYSAEFDYIVTKKLEKLTDFETILVDIKDAEIIALYFKIIGHTINALQTKSNVEFDYDEYFDYVMLRINKSETFSIRQKKVIINKLNRQLEKLKNEKSTNSLVSDLSFVNIHFKENMQIVLIDMEGATFGSLYQNIAQVYLNIKFGVLSKFIENKKKTEAYFNAFIEGCQIKTLNKIEFILYQFRYLISYINLTTERRKKSKNWLEHLQFHYNLYRYKKHIFKILTEE